MTQQLARLFLRLAGWQAQGEKPSTSRFVLIAAPHTSNWDLPYILAFAAIYEVKISWMGKHSLFRPPMGWLMKRLGGIPIVRHRKGNIVSQMTQAFQEREELALVVPPEGTRSYVAHWKSGFYHIARSANVPIVFGFLDYEKRLGGFGPTLYPSDDLQHDMNQIRNFYADKIGKYPELCGEIRLKEEM